MESTSKGILSLILLRPLLASLVVGLAFFVSSPDPELRYLLQVYLAGVLLLSLLYLSLWRHHPSQERVYRLQFYADFLLVSFFVYISGGIDSLFVPLYFLIVVYASILGHQRGGLQALGLSLLSYGTLAHLSYWGWSLRKSSQLSYGEVVIQFILNALALVAVTLLGIYLSERLARTRRELGATRLLHQNIVNSIWTGLMTLDRKGNITSLNRAAERIWGFREAELRGLSISSLLPEPVTRAILAPQQETPRRLEAWIRNKEGRRRFLGLSCSPLLHGEAEQIGFVLSFQDLTEIRRREEELELKEKMALIGQVAADMAHEIRNPLASLYGSIQVLETELRLKNDQQRLLRIVLRECERLNKILTDFIEYARPRRAVPKRVNLVPLVEETVRLLRNSPDFQAGHRVNLKSQPSVIASVDPDQIRQVIWNVLQNGLRAMPEGGELDIELSNGSNQVCLLFRDHGLGMDERERKRLFQPFHSSFRGGTGLGMSIVYQIIQGHHGKIRVQSEQGRGTLIEIRLPRSFDQGAGHLQTDAA